MPRIARPAQPDAIMEHSRAFAAYTLLSPSPSGAISDKVRMVRSLRRERAGPQSSHKAVSPCDTSRHGSTLRQRAKHLCSSAMQS